uniref:FAD-dependent oxidoreductase domain-containing protein 1 n=1 Tax=Tetradesmus obliquus TaxID=3088 RepID=A0A383V6D9_TETOB|eukprot:jgi/Sobl393_1/13636/SZX60352.1
MHALHTKPPPRPHYGVRCCTFPSTLFVSHSSSRRSACIVAAVGSSSAQDTVDVAVIGSGIIGLCVARKLLQDTQLSVALLDAKQPCAGATGAGQGYIWLAHRDPASPSWPLARRSKAMWQQLAAAAGSSKLGTAMEWQENGSLLLATSADEVAQLQARAAMLQQQGVPGVVLLSPRELKMAEPALKLPTGSHGLLVKSDAQINGKQTAFAMLEDCQQLAAAAAGGSAGQTSQLLLGLQEPVVGLQPLGDGAGVEVTTQKRRVRARQGVVVAAGVWSGQLLAAATGQQGWQQLLQPRRGHLLEMQPPAGMPRIHTGMMELSYTQHYSSSSEQSHGTAAGNSSSSSKAVHITFTATTSASGTLLIGSSREFSGWEALPDAVIIDAIMQRASCFLPHLSGISAQQLLATTRVGLRPFAVGGLPSVGLVPGLPGVAVAAGHEGSGLCLGPATADLVLHQLLGLDLAAAAAAAGGGGGGEAGGGVTADELLAAAKELAPERRLASLAAASR